MEFIPFAESTGHIVEIGRWVRTEACRQMQAWLGAFPELRTHFTMCVNLSAVEIRQPDLALDLSRTLKEFDLEPYVLELELTESMLHNDEGTRRRLDELRQIGVTISVDDFGTEYSSLACLRLLPVSTLKIDRAFISDVCRDEKAAALVGAVIDLANPLRLDTIAEGIEDEQQLQTVRQLGCRQGQGFYLFRPVDAETSESLLATEAAAALAAS